MAVSSLFDSTLQVVLREVTHYERGFPYLPGNVRTRLARVMAKRGLLHRGNMPLVDRTSSSTLQPSSIILWLCCHSVLAPTTFNLSAFALPPLVSVLVLVQPTYHCIPHCTCMPCIALCDCDIPSPPTSLPLLRHFLTCISLFLFLPSLPPATRCSMTVSWTWISVSVC